MQARRDKQIKDGLPPDFLDCDDCLANKTEHDRRCLGCGFLPKSMHLSGDRPLDAEVCPGYSVRLPEVAEAARAFSWSKRGGLVPLYGVRQLPRVAIEAVEVLDAAAAAVERRLMQPKGDVDGA